jgi:hypothetical protein
MTQQTAEVPRKPIPADMWTHIFHLEANHYETMANAKNLSLRNAIIRVGEQYGFTESELESRGLISRANRAKEYFEGGR